MEGDSEGEEDEKMRVGGRAVREKGEERST